MMEMLELSERPAEHLAEMGFNKEEVQDLLSGVGLNVYPKFDLFNKYWEHFDRSAQVSIFIKEPEILPKLIARQSKQLFKTLDYGNYTKSSNAEPRSVSLKFSNIKKIRDTFYQKDFLFFAFILLAVSVILIKKIDKSADMNSIYKYLVFLSFPVFTILMFFTVLLADSGHEIVKHFFLMNLMFDCVVFMFSYFIVSKVVRLLKK